MIKETSKKYDRISWKKIDIKDLAGLIAQILREDGIEAILVGGACVTIYSHNRYMSYDLDFITYEDRKKIRQSLKKLDFYEKDRHFSHADCPFLIELVTPPVAVGHEIVRNFELLTTEFGSLKLLRDVDSVKDRLASFYYWGDKQGLNQALEVCLDRSIDFEELRRWSENEGFLEKFAQFYEIYKSNIINDIT